MLSRLIIAVVALPVLVEATFALSQPATNPTVQGPSSIVNPVTIPTPIKSPVAASDVVVPATPITTTATTQTLVILPLMSEGDMIEVKYSETSDWSGPNKLGDKAPQVTPLDALETGFYVTADDTRLVVARKKGLWGGQPCWFSLRCYPRADIRGVTVLQINPIQNYPINPTPVPVTTPVTIPATTVAPIAPATK